MDQRFRAPDRAGDAGAEGRVVLVGIDGSEEARLALDRGVDEARARNCTVRLLGAYPRIDAGDPEAGQRATQAVMRDNAEHLAEARAIAEAAGVPVEVVEVTGDAAQAIVKSSGSAALVVLGKRGRGGALRGRLGSVSAAVAAHAVCPVIIVPGRKDQPADPSDGFEDFALEPAGPIGGEDVDFSGCVVVGIDARGSAHPALRQAVDYAQHHGKTLVLTSVNVVLTHTPDWFQEEFDTDRYVQASEQKLADIAEEIVGQHRELTVEHHIYVGRPATILTHASRTADLVVVGSRGIGGFRGLLLGSVSQAVLHNSEGPVMVVPAPPEN